MQGLYFLAALVAIGWLAYWTAQEGREKPQDKRRWSPFEWRDDSSTRIETTPNGRTQAKWRDRTQQRTARPTRGTRGR